MQSRVPPLSLHYSLVTVWSTPRTHLPSPESTSPHRRLGQESWPGPIQRFGKERWVHMSLSHRRIRRRSGLHGLGHHERCSLVVGEGFCKRDELDGKWRLRRRRQVSRFLERPWRKAGSFVSCRRQNRTACLGTSPRSPEPFFGNPIVQCHARRLLSEHLQSSPSLQSPSCTRPVRSRTWREFRQLPSRRISFRKKSQVPSPPLPAVTKFSMTCRCCIGCGPTRPCHSPPLKTRGQWTKSLFNPSANLLSGSTIPLMPSERPLKPAYHRYRTSPNSSCASCRTESGFKGTAPCVCGILP